MIWGRHLWVETLKPPKIKTEAQIRSLLKEISKPHLPNIKLQLSSKYFGLTSLKLTKSSHHRWTCCLWVNLHGPSLWTNITRVNLALSEELAADWPRECCRSTLALDLPSCVPRACTPCPQKLPTNAAVTRWPFREPFFPRNPTRGPFWTGINWHLTPNSSKF